MNEGEEESLPPIEWQVFLESPQWRILVSWLNMRAATIKNDLTDPEKTLSLEEVRFVQGQVDAFADFIELPRVFLDEAIADRERDGAGSS